VDFYGIYSLGKFQVSDDFRAFTERTCWLQGLYIYRQLHKRNDESAHYGVTKDIDLDGTLDGGQLCTTRPRLGKKKSENCEPMEKEFFLQVCRTYNLEIF